MQDFGDLVYLDVQKTGSTFVEEFLRRCCTLPCLKSVKHGRVTGEYRRDAYYFITVRHPLAQYMSLFRYGADGFGGVFGRLRNAGLAGIYEKGFEPWLEFVLDPANAEVLGEGYQRVAHTGIGFMTFRFVVLSMAYPMQEFPSAQSVDDVRALYAKRNLARRVIRNEYLNAGLRALAVEDVPQWFKPDEAKAFLAGERINQSRSATPPPPSPDLVREMERREAFILDRFYTDGAAA